MTAATCISPPQLQSKLSARRCRAYEQLAMSVVKRTVSQYAYHTGSEAAQRSLDAKNWKLLKKRENIRIYKSREKFQPNLFVDAGVVSSPGHPVPAQWAPHSKLLCVGTLVGTLDDAMLGTVTPTEFAMASRSLAIKDEFIDHRVLQDIRQPTTDEPFEYVGLKWALRASSLRSIVRPRDLVFVEASGFQYVPLNGRHERIGYTLRHSVDIPELQPATTTGAVRARFSLCSIYRQKAPGVVEVFVTVVSDPGGNVRPKLAAQSAAGALIAASKVMDCALERKLAWLLKTKYTAAVSPDGACVAVAKVQGSHWCCLRCTRQLSSFAALSSCGVCQSAVCSRCVTPRKLVVGTTRRDALLKSVSVCTGCMATALRGVNINHVAAEEFVPVVTLPPRRKLTCYDQDGVASPTSREAPSPHRPGPTHHAKPQSPTAPIVLYEEELHGQPETTHPRPVATPKRIQVPSAKPLELSDLETTEEEPTEDEGGDDGDGVLEVEPISLKEAERLRLLEQMNELRHQAEQTFRMTKRQTRSLQRSKLDCDARFSRRALSKSAMY